LFRAVTSEFGTSSIIEEIIMKMIICRFGNHIYIKYEDEVSEFQQNIAPESD